jgi:hypothetical protein
MCELLHTSLVKKMQRCGRAATTDGYAAEAVRALGAQAGRKTVARDLGQRSRKLFLGL